MSYASVDAARKVDEEFFQGGLSYRRDVHYAIKQHIVSACEEFVNLISRREEYHFGGRSAKVLVLAGTLPMIYQGITYNIPVKIYLPEMYPIEAPHVFVDPTPEMEIKANHSCTSPKGRVTSQYVRTWTHPRSNLKECLQDVSVLFGREPPVHSRPARPVPSLSTYPEVPVYRPSSSSSQSRPPEPPDPFPQPAQSSGFSNPIHQPNPVAGFVSFLAGAAKTHVPNLIPMLNNNQQQQQQQPPPAPATSAASGTPYFPGGAVGYPSAATSQPQGSTPTGAADSGADEAAVADEFKKVAVEALMARVTESLAASTSGIQKHLTGLEESKHQLARRREVLQAAVAGKKAELAGLERNVTRLSRASQQLDTWLATHEPKAASVNGAISPEDVVVPADALSRQAVEAQATDMAIEDTIRALDHGLQEGVLPVDVYLKQMRAICRRQFEARLLGIKVQEAQKRGAGSTARQAAVVLPQGDTWATTAILPNPIRGLHR